jgi:tetratricopeptide (TPR) repeat protein/transcriptional regulator with XRE-family HTH domain
MHQRRRLGLTQEELARQTGLSVRTIGGLEAGRGRVPRASSIRALADAFGLTGAEREDFNKQAEDARGAPAGAPAEPTRGAPAQLPADVATFTGRDEELAVLDAALTGTERPAVGIAAVSGTAGVGKTALAIYWAHRARSRFPDGQLYVNLRGYDPGRPVAPEDALAGFLTALGVPGHEIPYDLDDRAARYRTETADRRMLVVLDNAATVEQVRPLLPGSASVAVLVTSRDCLAGLVARDGASRLDLDRLPTADAVALLRQLIGERADADPVATEALAERCARLPLALRVIAELAVSRPLARLCELVAELDDVRRRLDWFDAAGDPRTAVPVAFSWSLRHLPDAAARAFPLLGLHPGPDFDPYAVAALAGMEAARAQRALEALANARLIELTGRHAGVHRYGMHDLLRAYAIGLVEPDEERAALRRLFDYYVAAASAAMDRLHPAEAHRRPAIEPAATPVPEIEDTDAARDWLDAERATLVSVAGYTAGHGWPTHTVLLAQVVYRYVLGGHNFDALALHRHALDAAEAIGDQLGQAQALLGLGTIHFGLGRYADAIAHHKKADALFCRADDTLGRARVQTNLGMVEVAAGRYVKAAGHHRSALGLYRLAGDRIGEARALGNLGILDTRLHRYGDAARRHREALALFRELDDREGEATALHSLGDAEERLGDYDLATNHLQHALSLFRVLGSRVGIAWAEDSIGTVRRQLGRPALAATHHRRALRIFRDIGDREGEAAAMSGLAEALRVAGEACEAIAHGEDALAIAGEIGARDKQATINVVLGQAYAAAGDRVRARECFEAALATYAELGAAVAVDETRQLAASSPPASPPPAPPRRRPRAVT